MTIKCTIFETLSQNCQFNNKRTILGPSHKYQKSFYNIVKLNNTFSRFQQNNLRIYDFNILNPKFYTCK